MEEPRNQDINWYDDPVKAAEIYGVKKTREMFEDAIAKKGLLDDSAKELCLKYAELETSLNEVDRARAIYLYGSVMMNPETDPHFWIQWNAFEEQFGCEDTIFEMLRTKRSVDASYRYAGIKVEPELFNLLLYLF